MPILISYKLCRLSPKWKPGQKRARTVLFTDISLDLLREKRKKTRVETGIYVVGPDHIWKFVEGVDVTKAPVIAPAPNPEGAPHG